jgi:hypothetical protein
VARRFDHLAAFVRVHAHRFLAKHRLASSNRGENVLQVAGIGSGYQHGVNFGAVAELFRGGKGKAMRDAILRGGFACFLCVSARYSNHFAIPGKRESRHQPPHCVQSETCDAKANHVNFTGFSKPPSLNYYVYG